jgi:hypothetical protein
MFSSARRDCLTYGSGLGLSVSLGLGLFVTGCAMPSFIAAPKNAGVKPKVKVGDTWSYAEINRYNNIRQAVVTHRVSYIDPIIRISHSAQSGPVGQEQTKERSEEIFDSLWTIKQEPAYDRVIVFERPLPFLPSVFEAGQREIFQTAYKVDGINALFYWRSQLFAAGWERVQVPAGEFNALRVERTCWFAHPDSFRSDAVRRDTIWYSPEVNRWVRREWTGEYRSPGSRRLPMREDWVRWDLLAYRPMR